MGAIIKPIGMLKRYIGDRHETSCAAGITVRQALRDVSIPPELVALVTVNGDARDKDYLIHEDDIIHVMAVIGGGSRSLCG